eukprot:13610869-Alexandrium_andersonii.AAC.1
MPLKSVWSGLQQPAFPLPTACWWFPLGPGITSRQRSWCACGTVQSPGFPRFSLRTLLTRGRLVPLRAHGRRIWLLARGRSRWLPTLQFQPMAPPSSPSSI